MGKYISYSYKTCSDFFWHKSHVSSAKPRYNGVTIPKVLSKCKVFSKTPLAHKGAVLNLLRAKYNFSTSKNSAISKEQINALEKFCVAYKVNFLLAVLLELNQKDAKDLRDLGNKKQTFKVYIDDCRDFFKKHPESVKDFAALLK